MPRRPSRPLAAAATALTLAWTVPALAQDHVGVDDKIMGVERTLFDLPDSGTEVDITRFEPTWRGGIIADTFRYEQQEGGAIVTFKVENGTVADAIAGFDERIGRVVKEVKRAGKPKTATLNDMKAAGITGEGLCGDDACDFKALIYQSREDTVVIAIAFVNKDRGKARMDEAAAFIGNVDLSDEERAVQNKPRKKGKKKK